WAGGAGAGFLVLLLVATAWPKGRQWAPVLLIPMVAVELFFARRQLEAFKSVPAEAYTSPRPALTYLLGDRSDFRVLSIVDSAYDAGDKRKLLEVYRGRLRPERINEMLVGMKYREMLAPNLSVAYRIPTIDGYDGGILPLRAYVEFKRPILDSSSDRQAPPGPPIPNQADALLRNQLRAIPDARLLGALSVKYVLMDKRRDVWIDNVYYDLGTTAVASPGSPVRLDDLPQVSTTAIGAISFLEGATQVPDGTPVARVTVAGKDGRIESLLLRAGVETAEGDYPAGKAQHGRPRVATAWKEGPSGVNYYGRLDLKEPLKPVRIEVEYLMPSGRLYLRAMSLIDGPALAAGSPTAFDSVMLDQRLRLVQSGDLKVYENLDYLSRAFVVHQASLAPTMEETFARMKGDLQRQAVLEDTPAAREAVQALGSGEGARDDVEIMSNKPERVLVWARMASPGILVLTDTNFPGWSVRVDGAPAPMLRADHLFRAVFVPGGEHTVDFTYAPNSYKRGVLVSFFSLGLVLLLLALSFTPAWKSRIWRGKDV
ncbi:MAG: hypothetical protein HY677_07340, partial [Chloroflexi bacterium]|nr:hypothetical protein [Chloroflexota bacterium]